MSAPAAEPLHVRVPRSALAGVRRARRRVLLHRRPLAALAVLGAVLAGTHAVSPPPPRTVPVWTASRDVDGGATLTTADLTRTALPPDAVPAGAVRRAASVVGRTVSVPLARGEVLTAARTLTPSLLTGYPDRTAVPVRVADADVVGLLRVGDRLTLVATDPDGRSEPAVLAAGAPVVALPRARSSALGSADQGRLVVLAVPDDAAAQVAARAAQGFLSVLWTH